MTHPENELCEPEAGDWIIHSGPSALTRMVNNFCCYATCVVDATPSHLVTYFPHTGVKHTFDRRDWPNWRYASPAMVRATWEDAQRNQAVNRPGNPVQQAEMDRYGVPDQRRGV